MNTPDESLGIIAGNRTLPLLFARQARAMGVHRLVAVAFEGETDPSLEKLVDEILRPFHNADLSQHPAFTGKKLNPSAENIARHIGERIAAGLSAITPAGAPMPRLASVRLTEAPGCAVIYQPT